PACEPALLAVAANRDLQGLREEARKVRLAAEDRDALAARQRAQREVRHWVDEEGMVAGRFRLPPAVGTPFVHRLEAETDRVYREAYRDGRREARVASAADALVRLCAGTGSPVRAELTVVVDVAASRRGGTQGEERCHIPGV